MNLQFAANSVPIALIDLFGYVIGGDWGKEPEYKDENFDLACCIRGSEFRKWREDKGKTASLRKIKKNNIASRRVQEGDILIEISGGSPEQPVGRTVLIDKAVLAFKPEIPKICTNFLRLARPVKQIDPKYLHLFLSFFYHSGDVVMYQGGSNNLRNLKFDAYATIQVPLVSLSEQHRIVAKIETLFSSLDKGIESLKTAQAQLKIYRQAVLKWAFEGKLTNKDVKDGELPKGWAWKNLKDVCEIKRGKSKHRPRGAKELFGGNYPFIQTGEIRAANGGIIREYNQTYSDVGLAQSKLWQKNTLCLTIAANIGETAFLGFDACFPDSVVGVVAYEMTDIKFINFFIQRIKQELSSKASATAQKNINVEFLDKIAIPLPLFSEQIGIVQEIESRLSVCDKIEESLIASLAQAEALRQSILKKAFEGKLVPQDPKETSAAALLAQLKAEKTKNNGSKSKK